MDSTENSELPPTKLCESSEGGGTNRCQGGATGSGTFGKNTAPLKQNSTSATYDINSMNKYGTTALIRAIMRCEPLTIKALLSEGADVNVYQPPSRTPLRWAMDMNIPVNICILIVNSGALVHAEEMLFAIGKEQTALVECMVDNGAMPRPHDITTESKRGLCLLNHYPARDNRVFKTVELTPFLAAVYKGNVELVDTFLSINFFHETDLYRASANTRPSPKSILDLFESIYCSPWSLWTLCFVKISTCVGLESDRRDRISQTGLPQSLQNKLMFGVCSKK